MDQEITRLMAMLKRWKKEADSFFEGVNRTGYEPKGDVSHIWANLSGAALMVEDSIEEYEEIVAAA
jgi:DNA-binding winged helix-turn-helix (wHTH) protein